MSSAWNASDVTPDGAAWLASAGTYPRSTLALWQERPDAPVVLPCGSVFDVVSAPALFGRRMLDRLWDDCPGSGPVAEFRGRMLLFAAPGTAQRLPALLEWEEWGTRDRDDRRTDPVPPLLCHGTGDAVTVPAPSER
ncbi:bifunctional DNA primase/polymerase, partial [Streptomyces indiaensis]